MIVTEKYTMPAVEAREVDRVAGITCDVCKAMYVGARQNSCDNVVKWNKDDCVYDLTVIQTMHHSGGIHGGYISGHEYHVCPTCFVEKIDPFLASLGAQATPIESDF